MEVKTTRVRCAAGASQAIRPNQPVIDLVKNGRRSYLWIGNGSEIDQWCFATVGGVRSLRKLAMAILAEVDAKAK